MRSRRVINPAQQSQRMVLRSLGGVLAAVGAVFAVIGVGSFFSSFGSMQPPQYFWCAFVGLPLLVIGIRLLILGYMGTVTRYVAGETVPVVTDTINYVADETKDSIREVVAAVSDGLHGRAGATVACGKCGKQNEADAHFCDQCGAPMRSEIACPKCGEENAPSAHFCNACGERLAAAG